MLGSDPPPPPGTAGRAAPAQTPLLARREGGVGQMGFRAIPPPPRKAIFFPPIPAFQPKMGSHAGPSDIYYAKAALLHKFEKMLNQGCRLRQGGQLHWGWMWRSKRKQQHTTARGMEGTEDGRLKTNPTAHPQDSAVMWGNKSQHLVLAPVQCSIVVVAGAQGCKLTDFVGEFGEFSFCPFFSR